MCISGENIPLIVGLKHHLKLLQRHANYLQWNNKMNNHKTLNFGLSLLLLSLFLFIIIITIIITIIIIHMLSSYLPGT